MIEWKTPTNKYFAVAGVVTGNTIFIPSWVVDDYTNKGHKSNSITSSENYTLTNLAAVAGVVTGNTTLTPQGLLVTTPTKAYNS